MPVPSLHSLPAELAAEPVAPFFVVMNAASGEKDNSQVREQIESVLREAGRPFEIIELDCNEVPAAFRSAAQKARASGGVLVAVGGDGTINCAAQAAVAQGCPLGVIAQGTFNLFARDHGLPLDAEEAARLLLTAQPTPVDVGLINQRVFLVNASLGLYPQILADREEFKNRFGRHRWVALLAGVVSLLGWQRRLALEMEQDGHLRNLRTPTLFVGNNRLQLERVGVDALRADWAGRGGLVAIAPKPVGSWAKLRLLVRGLLGSLAESEEVETFLFRSLTVKTGMRRRLKVATDGEVVWMVAPLRFSVSPRPLLLMKPAEDRAS
jgi:diacylglycerol kinase family enzyme